MGKPTVYEMLQREIESLPTVLAEEVFDFVLFVKARRAEETYLWEQVEAAESYRQEHPDEVMTVTPEEWDELTARLEDEM